MQRRKKRLPTWLLAVLGVAVLGGAVWAICGTLQPADQGDSSKEAVSSSAAPSAADSLAATPLPTAKSEEWRAVWISYLEYQRMDFSTKETFTAEIAGMFDRIAAAGCNTVVAQVRPCGDAMYPSAIFPWSHFITGTQGQDPGYDPLAIMIEAAHSRGLKLEAWVNPYRVSLSAEKPGTLADTNPAAIYLSAPETAGYVHEVNGGLWYDPGVKEVQQLIANGAAELCANYDIDGIQFDDYFYPTTEADFDANTYAAGSGGASLADWRRANVDALVKLVSDTVRQSGKNVVFGISPQGNTDNNYNQQYSNVASWMADGWVDYVCPQIYWGFDYRTAAGSDRFAFANCLSEWTALPRAESVKLYVGLGAFRIKEGDGSAAASEEWNSGSNLARQAAALRTAGADGYGIYRYDSLWNDAEPLCAAELTALTAANQ